MSVNRVFKYFCWVLAFYAFTSCTSVKYMPVPQETQIPLLWSKKMKGAITSLNVSKNGDAILVATSPDPDIEGSASTYLLSKLNSAGHVRWQIPQKSPIRDQDISSDGSFSIISNYENELKGMDAQGKILWTIAGICRPQILNEAKKVLCYHDDDGGSGVGFEILDWNGNKILSHIIKRDILALKLAPDQRNLAIALTHGQVNLLDSNFDFLWERKIDGEVVDIGISAQENLKVAVLFKTPAKDWKIAVFDRYGTQLGIALPSFRPRQIEINAKGDGIFYYGNSPEGQYVASLSPLSFQEAWKRGSLFFSEFSSSINAVGDRVMMGFQMITDHGGEGHILNYDLHGELKWNVTPPAAEGSYIYIHQVAQTPSLLVVGTDDAKISAYRMR